MKIKTIRDLKNYLSKGIPATFNAKINKNRIIFQNGDVFTFNITKNKA